MLMPISALSLNPFVQLLLNLFRYQTLNKLPWLWTRMLCLKLNIFKIIFYLHSFINDTSKNT